MGHRVDWEKIFNLYPHTCNLIYGWISGAITKRPITYEKFWGTMKQKNVVDNEELLFKYFDGMHILVGVMPISKNNFKVLIKGLERGLSTDEIKTRSLAIKYAVENSIQMLEERILEKF
jgi:hypothetical protein